MKNTILPFGPQHPVLPEPLMFDLILEDETVIDAIPALGFVHRGLELLVHKKEYTEFTYVAERICGICSFIHGMGYCVAIEELMKVETPARAEMLRVLWSELSRIHSHLLWLGLAADAFGFENLFMQTWRLRETVINIFEETTGGRVIFSVCKVGGVRKDIDSDTLKRIAKTLLDMKQELKTITDIFLFDPSIKHRLCGVGVLTKENAWALGAAGPMLRASGVSYDLRQTGYSGYNLLDFTPIVEKDGDCWARCAVRVHEIFQSIDLIRQAVDKMPEGPHIVKVLGTPPVGESFVRMEQPRGEVLYYAKGNGTKFLDRFRVRTPTFANIPAIVSVMKGSNLADIPNLVLTIDPCISCTER